MNAHNRDIGSITVIIQRMVKQHLPRIDDINNKLDAGQSLNDYDVARLSDAINDVKLLSPYIERHPEYKPLIAKVIHYYDVISDKALALTIRNEKDQ